MKSGTTAVGGWASACCTAVFFRVVIGLSGFIFTLARFAVGAWLGNRHALKFGNVHTGQANRPFQIVPVRFRSGQVAGFFGVFSELAIGLAGILDIRLPFRLAQAFEPFEPGHIKLGIGES